jgi:hypothetical protein
MYPRSVRSADTNTALVGTPEWHCFSLWVIQFGPVSSSKARVYKILEDKYRKLIAQLKADSTNIALKKCASLGRPASTTAMTKTDLAPTDGALPLMYGWLYGTTSEAVNMAKQESVTMRRAIFRAAIFILSAFPRDLLSAAVAAKISIPV